MMDPHQQARFKFLERRIERGLSNWWEVGDALREIKDRRLYREQYGTFEKYCQERWGIGRQHAYRQIRASLFMQENCSPRATNSPESLPENERQARAARLATLDRKALEQLPPETKLRLVNEEDERAIREAPSATKPWSEIREHIEFHARQMARLARHRPAVAVKAEKHLERYLELIRAYEDEDEDESAEAS